MEHVRQKEVPEEDGFSTGVRMIFRGDIGPEFFGGLPERTSYPLDSITTFQHLPLTTASVCPIMGPLPRRHLFQAALSPLLSRSTHLHSAGFLSEFVKLWLAQFGEEDRIDRTSEDLVCVDGFAETEGGSPR